VFLEYICVGNVAAVKVRKQTQIVKLMALSSSAYALPVTGPVGGQKMRHSVGGGQDIVDQCKTANVAVWLKQIPIDGKVVDDIKYFPKELQYREYPQ
jgi:hypothetical protein